jgi:hypothetical protein
MAQRIRITRMPSSIREKAHSSMEPKKIGVKINREIRMSLMAKLNIAQSSKLKAQSKTEKLKVESKTQDFLFKMELINPLSMDAISFP